MENEFVPYEQALVLKELGFDEPCFGIWMERGKKHDVIYVAKQENAWMAEQNEGILAPLFQQVFRWFRETYNLHSCVAPVYEDETKKVILYWFWIQGFDDFDSENIDYKTPEEAELACLIKLIEIVKDEK